MRIDARQQRNRPVTISRWMMRIGLALRLADAPAQAFHIGVAGPVEGGQGASRFSAFCRVFRRRKMNSADKFAPAEDLAHETPTAFSGAPSDIRVPPPGTWPADRSRPQLR